MSKKKKAHTSKKRKAQGRPLLFPESIIMGPQKVMIIEKDSYPEYKGSACMGLWESYTQVIEIYRPDAPAYFDRAVKAAMIHELTHAAIFTRIDIPPYNNEAVHEPICSLVAQVLYPALLARPDWVKVLFDGKEKRQ